STVGAAAVRTRRFLPRCRWRSPPTHCRNTPVGWSRKRRRRIDTPESWGCKSPRPRLGLGTRGQRERDKKGHYPPLVPPLWKLRGGLPRKLPRSDWSRIGRSSAARRLRGHLLLPH